MSKLGSVRPPVEAILVVDDEPDILESLSDVFALHLPGVKIFTASNGTEGLKLLAKEKIGLVISDYKMPGMDGLEFLTKACQVAPAAPRILITAYPELNVAVRAINEAQIQNFLTKPITPQALLEAVNAALLKGRSAAQKAASAPAPPPGPAVRKY
ncbi:MAG: response regulator [Candidatus Thermoplasmatota archaeon]|jgi:DNA-binding NtrC family response regulator